MNRSRSEYIGEHCSKVLTTAKIDHILIIEPSKQFREILEEVWRQMIDKKPVTQIYGQAIPELPNHLKGGTPNAE